MPSAQSCAWFIAELALRAPVSEKERSRFSLVRERGRFSVPTLPLIAEEKLGERTKS